MKARLLSVGLAIAMLFTAAPTAQIAAAESDPQPIVHYTFDENGTTTADSSGYNRTADIFGTTETADEAVFGKSLLLKGGYVHLPSDIFLGATAITISIWTNPLRATPNSRLWDLGSNSENFLNLFAPLDEGGLKFASALRVNNVATRIPASTATFSTNAWRNITVTYTEANNGMLTIYENGTKIGSGATNKKLSDLGEVVNAYIGRAQFGVDPDYYGYVDDFRIYHSVLTDEQIADMTNEGFASLLKNTANGLDLALRNNITRLDAVQQDLRLFTSTNIKQTGAQITWESSNEAVISKTGTLGTPGDATLTATLTRGAQTATASYDITVTANPLTLDPVPPITVALGEKPTLPGKITANNGAVSVSVTWDAVTPNDYAFAGTKTIAGKTEDNQPVEIKLITDDTLLTNPIIRQGKGGAPDPYIAYYDGYYYYVRHHYNVGVTVAKAKRLQDIGSAPRVLVYEAPSSGLYSKEYWAPEIFFIDGNWYIYVAADNGDNANHRMYVLEGTDPNNAQAPYIMKGKIAPTVQNESGEWEIDPAQDKWAIDGTVLEDINGKDYFIWSGWQGNVDGEQCIYIAEMLNPYTLKGDRILLNRPSAQWERKGVVENSGGLVLNEGPQVITHNGKVMIVYSANHSGTDWYCLGSLTADMNADLLDPAAWTKSKGPLFTQSLDPNDHSSATGHAMFTPSPDGTETYLVYHAFQTLGANVWDDRSARITKINWDGDTLLLGNPIAEGVHINQPSGTESVLAGKYEAEDAVLAGGATAVKLNRPSGGYAVKDIGTNASVTFNVKVPQTGKYLLSFLGSSLATSGKCYQNVTVHGKTYKIYHSGVNNPSGIWTTSADATSAKLDGLYVDLFEGENEIVVTRAADSSANADLDYLYLIYSGEATSEPPTPTPPNENTNTGNNSNTGNNANNNTNTGSNTNTVKTQTNGTAKVGKKTVLYKSGKKVTGTKVITVGKYTYAVKNGYVSTGTKNHVVKISKTKSYVVSSKGIVQKSKKNKIVKVGKYSYIVNNKGVIQKNNKSNKIVKIGKTKYVVNKNGVVQKNKKTIKVGKVKYKTNKNGVAKKK